MSSLGILMVEGHRRIDVIMLIYSLMPKLHNALFFKIFLLTCFTFRFALDILADFLFSEESLPFFLSLYWREFALLSFLFFISGEKLQTLLFGSIFFCWLRLFLFSERIPLVFVVGCAVAVVTISVVVAALLFCNKRRVVKGKIKDFFIVF